MSRAVKLPSLPPVATGNVALDEWIRSVTERLDVREGGRGVPDEKVVTLRDLKSLGLDTTTWPTTNNATGGVLVQLPDGSYARVPLDSFSDNLRSTKLYKDLMRSIDDAARFDGYSEDIKKILLTSLADEAAARGAAIRNVSEAIQETNKSLAYQLSETTASLGSSLAGVRDITFANATEVKAQAGKVTQITAEVKGTDVTSKIVGPVYDTLVGTTSTALKFAVPTGDPTKYYQVKNPVLGQPVLLYKWDDADSTYTIAGKGVKAGIEQSMTATADRDNGADAQYTLKVDANGKVAGFGIAATSPTAGAATSAFLISADKFAILGSADQTTNAGNANYIDPTSPSLTRVPFGVDTVTNTIYLNGNVRIGGPTGTILNNVGKYTAFVYRQQAGQPSAPTGGSFNFSTNAVVAPTLWSKDIPTTSASMPTWVAQYTFSGSGTADVTAGTWSTPVAFIQNGAQGEKGNPGDKGDQGSPGIGTPGVRGSSHAYISGSAWSDAAAQAAIFAQTGASSLVAGDTVTMSNGTNYTMEGVWNGSWTFPTVVIDGNLLVSGSVKSTKIDTIGLSIKNSAGQILFDEFHTLQPANITPSPNWLNSNVTYASLPDSKPPVNATAGAQWGVNLSGTPANLAALTGAEAIQNNLITTTTLGALATNAQNSLTGIGGVRAGTISWDASGGNITGTGVAFTSQGITGAVNGTPTFSINTSGVATFGGTLSAPNGVLGTITGGDISIGVGAPFRVTSAGALTATNATITGNITMSGGSIAGSTTMGSGGSISLSSTGWIGAGMSSYSASPTGFWLGGNGTMAIGSSTKSITWDGSTFNINGNVKINGDYASVVQSGAAAGLLAQSGLTTKLDNAAANVMSGAFALKTANFDTAGVPGVAITTNGIVGKSATKTTFSIDATTGNAVFSGDITGSNGTFTGTMSANGIVGGTISGVVANFSGATSDGGITATVHANTSQNTNYGVSAGGAVAGIRGVSTAGYGVLGTSGGAAGVTGIATSASTDAGRFFGFSNTTKIGNAFGVDTDGVIRSSVATGTAPFSIASKTLCANLNVEYMSGYKWGNNLTPSGSTNPYLMMTGSPSGAAFSAFRWIPLIDTSGATIAYMPIFVP